uniref:Uncharacterized protein n=1 Tax=Tanacetum cinerariifolium TaxID=118510 RepID=A0A6L2N5C1_TANCI|nr:hypothetical protein [Tanacetum cinerariifolium]
MLLANIGKGPKVWDFENYVVRPSGDETNLIRIEDCNYGTRSGCKVLGSSFLGDCYEKYFYWSGSVWSAGEPSSGLFVRTQRGASVASPILGKL